LLSLLQNEPMAPVGIEISRNVIVGEQRWDAIEGKARPYLAMTDNLLGVGASVLSAARGPGQQIPRLDASAGNKIGFKPIPYEQIGLYRSPERAQWPVSHPVALRERAVPGSDLVPHPAAAVPVEVRRVASAPRVDGRTTAADGRDEYANTTTVRLGETPGREPLRTPAATARVGHDGRRLYVAVTVPLAQLEKLQKNGAWGAADGVEVALRLDSAKPGPIYILQGFPDGRLLTSPDGGAPPAASAALRTASAFAATVGGDSWTSEFAIDLAAAGIAAKPGTTLGFNIGARRNETDDWMAWTGTGSANWQLSGAGRIVLR
jgi:hypothetical protein